MRLNWLPWKFVIRRLARSHGLVDPVRLLSQINQLAQPAEVAAPVELLRASLVLHARGLLNARAIQSNLDWIWPYWVKRQFDPKDAAFVPRSYTLTHVNLTHRNWTAAGLPDCTAYPIVDPRGLVTPFFDGWSLDGWIVASDGLRLLPPLAKAAEQTLNWDNARLWIRSCLQEKELWLESRAEVMVSHGTPICRIRYRAYSPQPAWFAIALRPFNPEGVSFIHRIGLEGETWRINDIPCLRFAERPAGHRVSRFEQGDVFYQIDLGRDGAETDCKVGLASACALYRLDGQDPLDMAVDIDLSLDPETPTPFPAAHPNTHWQDALSGLCRFQVPDRWFCFLYESALRSVILHCPLDIYPGPFYYRRFWFRDAVFILYPMLCLGMHQRARRLMDRFPARQGMDGYFRSQQGEWDSNGQVMWIMRKYHELTGEPIPANWQEALVRAGKWIQRKRLSENTNALHAGLLPAGFSAEHLGHNDYYYWDDFWSIAGLEAGAELCERAGDYKNARRFYQQARDLRRAVLKSLERSRFIRGYEGIPASPYRRMDAGAVGSLVAGYPLKLLLPDDPRLLGTLRFLMDRCFVDQAFFQDMFHSGFNVYLSLHCAQTLLRAGQPGFFPIVQQVAKLASPTGQWPEAIHPHTGGGCQGDGQHIWAAAEWLMMLKNLFVDECQGGLRLFAGIPGKWLQTGQRLEMGPVHTAYGPITVWARPSRDTVRLGWEADWRKPPETIWLKLPRREARALAPTASGDHLLPYPPEVS